MANKSFKRSRACFHSEDEMVRPAERGEERGRGPPLKRTMARLNSHNIRGGGVVGAVTNGAEPGTMSDSNSSQRVAHIARWTDAWTDGGRVAITGPCSMKRNDKEGSLGRKEGRKEGKRGSSLSAVGRSVGASKVAARRRQLRCHMTQDSSKRRGRKGGGGGKDTHACMLCACVCECECLPRRVCHAIAAPVVVSHPSFHPYPPFVRFLAQTQRASQRGSAFSATKRTGSSPNGSAS